MKNLNILKAVLIAVFFSVNCNFTLAQSACTATSGSSSGQECLMDVKSFKLKVYEFSLCTDFATVADRSMCSTLYSNANGYDLTLSKTASLPLGGNTSLSEGTYTHAYIVVNNNTYLKSYHEFSTDREDLAGNTGKFCYSNGTDRTEDASFNLTNIVVTCGDSDLSAENKETIKFDDGSGNYSNADIVDPLSGGATSVGYTKLYTLKTISPAVAGAAWASDTGILASQKIANVKISPNTTGLNIAFSVTDGIALNFLGGGANMDGGSESCGAAGGNYCVVDVGWLGMNFIVTAN